MSRPLQIAAIDAGSNAIRVAISEATSQSETISIVSERVPVRLGHSTFVSGLIGRETLDQAIAAFARFRKLFDQHGVTHYRAVATSAVRNAKNRDQLIHRIFHETRIELEVIDGQEEARLVRSAVLKAFGGATEPAAIADLGGGSLEITYRDNTEWQTSSMRIGTVRLMETFGLTGAISADEGNMMKRYVASLLHSSVPEDALAPGATIAACGGNAEELARLFGTVDPQLGMPTLSAAQLAEALPRLLKYDIDKRMSKLDIRRDRAEVIGIAALVFSAVFDELAVDRLVVPQVGIKEGLLLELAETHAPDAGEAGSSARNKVLLAAARAFAVGVGHDISHGEQVRRIARKLFDQLEELHGLPTGRGIVLEVAALLHDVGEVVHRRGHHKHGEYMVLNGRIPGLESPEREMVAALVRAHRKSNPYVKKHLTYATLSEKQQLQVRRLNAILRVADAIDTDHRQRVTDVACAIINDKVVFRVTLATPTGETRHFATRKSEAFKEEFGRDVDFVVSVVPEAARQFSTRTE